MIKNNNEPCWNCLNIFDEEDIHKINIDEMGYGSIFDGMSTEIHLCNKCYIESTKNNKNLWNMEIVPCDFDNDYGFTKYKYEKEMMDYIDRLPEETKLLALSEENYYQNERMSISRRMKEIELIRKLINYCSPLSYEKGCIPWK